MEELLRKYEDEFAVTYQKIETYMNYMNMPQEKIYCIATECYPTSYLRLPVNEPEHSQAMEESRKLYAVKRVMYDAARFNNKVLQKQIAIHCFIHHPHIFDMCEMGNWYLPFVLEEFDPAYVFIRICFPKGKGNAGDKTQFNYKTHIARWKNKKFAQALKEKEGYLRQIGIFKGIKKRNKALVVTLPSKQTVLTVCLEGNKGSESIDWKEGNKIVSIPLIAEFSPETQILFDLKPDYRRVNECIFIFGQYRNDDKWHLIVPYHRVPDPKVVPVV